MLALAGLNLAWALLAVSLHQDFNADRRGGFPADSKRINLLGEVKEDDTDTYELSFEATLSKK